MQRKVGETIRGVSARFRGNVGAGSTAREGGHLPPGRPRPRYGRCRAALAALGGPRGPWTAAALTRKRRRRRACPHRPHRLSDPPFPDPQPPIEKSEERRCLAAMRCAGRGHGVLALSAIVDLDLAGGRTVATATPHRRKRALSDSLFFNGGFGVRKGGSDRRCGRCGQARRVSSLARPPRRGCPRAARPSKGRRSGPARSTPRTRAPRGGAEMSRKRFPRGRTLPIPAGS